MDHDGVGRHILSHKPRMAIHIGCEGAVPLPVILLYALGIVLFEAISPKDAISELMQRPATDEGLA